MAFIGQVHYTHGTYCGIVVDGEGGKNNGTIKGVKYFSCPERKGLMVKLDDILKI